MFALRGSAKLLAVRACALAFIGIGIGYSDTIIDFEQFSDGDRLTNQISGVEFTNVTIVIAGISLNEFEFPPHSGTNAAFDDGGPLTLSFTSPVLSFEGFFTYSAPLTIQGFGSGNTLLASAASLFSSNLGLSGDSGSSPNELLGIASDLGFTRITITGDPGGASFVMDDLSLRSSIIPEPDARLLAALGILALFSAQRCGASGRNL